VRSDRLARLLDPQSLAFIGGAAAERAIEQSIRMGFEGPMWAVHPTRDEVGGIPTVATVDDLPGVPDAVFVGVNRGAALEAIRALGALGAGVAVCHASGFAELDDAGGDLQRDLVHGAGTMAVVGPNCYGTISMTTGAVLWPDQQGLDRCERGVGFVTQSGNIAVNLTMQRRSLAVAQLINVGNQADVTIEDAMTALAADPRITGIGLHIEALTDARAFAAAASIANERGIPVVALKTGASAQGAAIAASHTSSMVGSDDAYDALFDRCCVRRVRSVPEFLDTLHVGAMIGPLPGNRIVSLSCSGGEASLVADRAESLNLDFAPFAPEHRARIAATLNEFVAISNPFDYHTFIWGDRDRLTACFTETLAGPHDAAMLVVDFPRSDLDATSWWPTLEAFAAASSTTHTPGVVTASMAEGLPLEVRRWANDHGLATVADIDTTLRALEATSRPLTAASLPLPAPASVPTVSIGEAAAKRLLAGAGLDVPNTKVVAAQPAAAVSAADAVGYPVTVKIAGLDHKSDSAGVHLDLRNADEVRAAVEQLDGLGPELLVEQFIGDSRLEVLVNLRAEYPLGWLLTLGAGGVHTELDRDTVSLLLAATDDEIDAALRSLRIGSRFDGFRGVPPISTVALRSLIAGLSELVSTNRHIREIELNPVIITDERAVAVDAIIVREDDHA